MGGNSITKIRFKLVFVILLLVILTACGSSSSNDPGDTGVITFTVGGLVTNMTGTGLVLQNNSTDDEPVTMNGPFTFDTPIANGADYEVTVSVHPTDQRCDVTLGNGTILSQNVINVSVMCNPLSTPKVAFVTSSFGTGNLNSWTDSGGLTGLAAGDAICQAHATRGGLTGNFVAWLSDSNADAYCRVNGFSGKRAANCGQAALPVNAGPWIRHDGYPFAPTIDLFSQGVMYAPIKFDESGLIPPAGFVIPFDGYYSGTSIDGSLSPVGTNCSDWTTSATGIARADTIHGSRSAFMQEACDTNFHLACFQTGTGSPLPVLPLTGKKVFITETWTTGNVGGLAGADAMCQAEADAQSLGGTFKAWLSTSTVNAIDRLTSNGPWIRVDGVKVAENKADLIDDEIFSTITVHADGNHVSTIPVWTGTNSGGLNTASNCNDWLDQTSMVMGTIGVEGIATYAWTSFTTDNCSIDARLYCFED